MRRLALAIVTGVALFATPAIAAGPTCQGQMATIVGDAGDNVLQGTSGDDVIWAGAGNDTIYAKQGNDIVCAGIGDDIVKGGPGADIILGAGGNDNINAGDGGDRVWGGYGADTIFGVLGVDRIWGGPGPDMIDGGGGHDAILAGGDHNDFIKGGIGFDVMRGGNGNDQLIGGWGDDDLFGDAGNDNLLGGRGNDRCFDGEFHLACETRTWSPITINGTGDDIVAFQTPGDATAVLRFSYPGDDFLSVWTLNANLEDIDLVVVEVGAYEGGRAINTGAAFDDTARYLDVSATGPWTAVIEPLALARRFSDTIEGDTDDVVLVDSSGILDVTYTGDDLFVIWAFEPDGDADLIVIESGPVTAAAVVAPAVTYLDISGIGPWTLDFR